MRRSFTALVTAGIAALSLVTGTAAASAAPQSTATPQISFTVLIDQFATHGPGGQNDQYVQLQNISQSTQDLSNFTLVTSIGGILSRVGIPIQQGTTLQQGQVYLFINAGFTGQLPPDNFQLYNNITLPDRVGICLNNPTNATVDAVATVGNSPCLRGAPAAQLTPGGAPNALVRDSNTDNNRADFHEGPRTPGIPSNVKQF